VARTWTFKYDGHVTAAGSSSEASWRRNFETLMVLTAGVLFSVLVEVLVRAGDRAQRPPPPPPSASKSA
jgi:hypothetical protein